MSCNTGVSHGSLGLNERMQYVTAVDTARKKKPQNS